MAMNDVYLLCLRQQSTCNLKMRGLDYEGGKNAKKWLRVMWTTPKAHFTYLYTRCMMIYHSTLDYHETNFNAFSS